MWMRTVWYWCQISVVKNNIFQRVNTSVCEYYLYLTYFLRILTFSLTWVHSRPRESPLLLLHLGS